MRTEVQESVQEIIQLGAYQLRVRRALEMYQAGAGSLDCVAEKAGLPKGDLVREALHGILDVITNQMAEGNAVTIAGFGRFEAKEHRKRRVEGPDRVQDNLLHADLSWTF